MNNKIKDQLQQLKTQNTLVVILVLLFVSILIWTGVSIYSSTTTSQLPANIKKLTLPLNPSIDREILDSISQKVVLSGQQLESFPIYRLILDKRTNIEKVITIDMDETVFTQPAKNTPTPQPNLLDENQNSPTSTPSSQYMESQGE